MDTVIKRIVFTKFGLLDGILAADPYPKFLYKELLTRLHVHSDYLSSGAEIPMPTTFASTEDRYRIQWASTAINEVDRAGFLRVTNLHDRCVTLTRISAATIAFIKYLENASLCQFDRKAMKMIDLESPTPCVSKHQWDLDDLLIIRGNTAKMILHPLEPSSDEIPDDVELAFTMPAFATLIMRTAKLQHHYNVLAAAPPYPINQGESPVQKNPTITVL